MVQSQAQQLKENRPQGSDVHLALAVRIELGPLVHDRRTELSDPATHRLLNLAVERADGGKPAQRNRYLVQVIEEQLGVILVELVKVRDRDHDKLTKVKPDLRLDVVWQRPVHVHLLLYSLNYLQANIRNDALRRKDYLVFWERR